MMQSSAVGLAALVLASCLLLSGKAATTTAANSRTLTQSLTSSINLNTSDTPVTINATTAGKFVRFLVVGDWGRTADTASLNQPQCSLTDFGGDNGLLGGIQQAETALEMDRVCQYVGGCQFVVGTGDNFYECGVYPGDTTGRLYSDWIDIYKNPVKTPTIANLTWYNVFGNHDMAINGSVEQEIAFTNSTPGWQIPSNYFLKDFDINGVTMRGIFVDSNPFIIKYNGSAKYYRQYFIDHSNPSYINQQQQFINQAMKSSTAMWTFVVSHYPLFGTATNYGNDAGAFPGQFNGWSMLLDSINQYKPVAYLNGHDHSLSLGVPPANKTNGYTQYYTSGAGSIGSQTDSCAERANYAYSNGGNGGFVLVTVNATVWQADYYTLGSNFPQCTVKSSVNTATPATYSPGCALGLSNTCCNGTNAKACTT
ncbi:hypothetical protein WJX74_008927 [Apatococcus lobatus]|uniref:Calcineurin-like phosphoesterase domain-containing protein n=1 Tax=Apatococcus lobatus TaxID=904363 RepID=A0AAW1S854_9CHLO